MLGNPTRAERRLVVDEQSINVYPCDSKTKEALRDSFVSKKDVGLPSVLQVAFNVYVVFGPQSASSPVGYVHVVKVGANQLY